MNKLIINADDFGKSEDINAAIIKTLNSNLCLDTTLLANFDYSHEAANYAYENKLINNIGIHLNLTDGIPMTDPIKKEKRFCNNDGIFHYRKDKRIYFLSSSERKAIFIELISQIQFCKKYGLNISHADSHNHIHEEPGLLNIILNILKQENIFYLRLAKNIGKMSILNTIYRNTYNSILCAKNINGSNYFGSISDFDKIDQKREDVIIEIMIHPGLIINGNIFDHYTKENLSINIPKILTNNALTSYYKIKS